MGESATYLGIDVGTASVRAGLFDREGRRLGLGVEPITIYRPREDFVEQSSDDVWRAAGIAVRQALAEAKVDPGSVRGIGFDATCSLVLLGEDDRPVTVSPTGNDAQNVIVWMDHRATDQAARINAGQHGVLRYVGGGVSPEMETPKLLWLKERLPSSWGRVKRFLDLPDFLVYRATGHDVRSLCTTVCKWTYLGHEGGWDAAFFRSVGLGELADEGFVRIGTQVRPMGERAGVLSERAAGELGLAPGIPVGVAIIDAHAGGLGVLGATVPGESGGEESLAERVALIGGTSTCHMAISREPRFVRGVWGPYFSAMVPGWWLTEGGQSATGALLDHVIGTHAESATLTREAATRKTHAAALLNERLEALAAEAKVPFPAALTRDLHVLPDHHGNRSPRADPTLRGMISGLKLGEGRDSLALLYLAAVQALALGTRHILEALQASGYRTTTLMATGGDAKNPVFLREHADATGCRVVLPREPEAVLLGSAMLGAVASGDRSSIAEAMHTMSAADRIIEPSGGAVGRYFDAKYAVFLRMHDDQLAYRRAMEAAGLGREA
ncbi:MAG TPA: FGGY-family carbohydrate kinase [Polyangiaceae bacterium]|jgi:FGGY-family pentulose kinase